MEMLFEGQVLEGLAFFFLMRWHIFFFQLLIQFIPGHCVYAQSCPILCNPMDCCPPGSSVHGISQARILE